MADFYNLIISKDDLKFFELILSKKNNQQPDFFTVDSPLGNLLKEKLLQNTYPTLEIIQNDESPLKVSSTFYLDIVKELLSKDLSFPDNLSKLLIFLTNFKIHINNQNELERGIITLITDKKLHKNDILLSLIFRTDFGLLFKYLTFITNNEKFPYKNSILIKLIPRSSILLSNQENKNELGKRFRRTFSRLESHISLKNHVKLQQHPTEILIEKSEVPENFKSLFILLRLFEEFHDPNIFVANLNNFSSILKENQFGNINNEIYQEIFFMEFHRIDFLINKLCASESELLNYLKLKDILQCNGIFSIFFNTINEYEIFNYEEFKFISNELHEYRVKFYNNKNLYNFELEIISYYFALKNCYEIILEKENYLQNLKLICRNLKLTQIISLSEDILKLLFLRWEQITCNSPHLTKLLSPPTLTPLSATDFETTVVGQQSINQNNLKSGGFICKTNSLKIILKFLKEVLGRRFHTEEYHKLNSNEIEKYKLITEVINDALKRLQLIEKCLKENNLLEIDSDQLLPLIKCHIDTNLGKNNSSDEESYETNYISLRRRTKNRKRSSIISYGYVKILEKDDLEKQNPTLRVNKENKSIMSRMLTNSESLAIICLRCENFDEAKQIIKGMNLQDSALEKEVKYLEKIKDERVRLKQIYERYLEQEISENPTDSIVDRIKKVAAIGFEVSKIINIIEKFIQMSPIEQTKEEKILLFEKHSKNNDHYQYLEQFDGNGLQILGVLDLILCTNFNFEICGNILNFLKRIISSSGSLKDPILSKHQIGAVQFFNNLIECMRISKNNNHNNKNNGIGLRNILREENTYSLKPEIFQSELKRESSFRTIFCKSSTDISNFEIMQAFSKYFFDFNAKINYFKRFYIYLENLSKLLKLRDKNLEFHLTELLRFDPKNLIGDLIFEENLTPFEIEHYVESLNLNLVHVIALNICPIISGAKDNGCLNKRISNFENQNNYDKQTIFNYLSSQNFLLGYLLQKINGTHNEFQNISEKCLRNFLELNEIHLISKLYSSNLYVSILLYCDIDYDKLKITHLFDDLTKVIILSQQFSIENYQQIKNFRSELIIDLITKNDSKFEIDNRICLIQNLKNLQTKVNILLENFQKIQNSNLLIALINSLLSDLNINDLNPELKLKLVKLLTAVKIYSKIAAQLNLENWMISLKLSKLPIIVIKKLLEINNLKLLYEWSKIAEENPFSKNYFQFILPTLIDLQGNFHYLFKFIESKFTTCDIIEFYNLNKEKFRNLDILKYVLEYLEKNTSTNYRNYKISVKIFEFMSETELESNWNLIDKPLLLIEQFIMNSKFETFAKIHAEIKEMIKILPLNETCKFCHEKIGNVYNNSKIIIANRTFQLGISEFFTQNFNLYQKEHNVTLECVDLLLRTYATKALDYQINEYVSSSERNVSRSTDLASMDSLCDNFVMPKVPPAKNGEHWIKDEDALYCMCCKISVFTMLLRRHHCRRCGRVVCFSCSKNRIKILELYDEVLVRVCLDCFNQTSKENEKKTLQQKSTKNQDRRHMDEDYKWQLSGNLTHDKVLREEFCYEHAPSVSLCLSILFFHSNNIDCVNLLLYHCEKLEKLFVPNPEVDFALVAKMLNCLAVAAKVRGGPVYECDKFRDHSDIVMSLVQQGCETLLPTEQLNNETLKKLGDLLILNERWSLALDVFLKCCQPTKGVLAAHGLSCLRAGCFETAREKFSYFMTKLCYDEECLALFNIINKEQESDFFGQEHHIPIIRRPNRSPPLLSEIIHIIETTANIPQEETLTRAGHIRSSNSSLASSKSKRSNKLNIPINEPALNILNKLANLKQVTKGNYSKVQGSFEILHNRKFLIRQSCMFEECLYYIFTYGSHDTVIDFLIHHKELQCALKYFLIQSLDSELFIQKIYMEFLKIGQVEQLITELLKFDKTLKIWRTQILNVCRYLESKNLLNSLYQLQLLMKDPVRASMTCVRFYSINCLTFCELNERSIHLENANVHLQSELESIQWIKLRNGNGRKGRRENYNEIPMEVDLKTLNGYLNTILKQIEITKFLANCEQNPRDDKLTPAEILKQIRPDTTNRLPTLFDSIKEKIEICLLILICGKNIEQGFDLVTRIIYDYKLAQVKVYGTVSKYLERNNRLIEVNKLIECILNYSSNGSRCQNNIDEILSSAIRSVTVVKNTDTKNILDTLIKKISNVELQINSYCHIGQLKSAYLLAIQHNRLNDIRKILRQAELTNQIHIKKLCEKKLNLPKRT